MSSSSARPTLRTFTTSSSQWSPWIGWSQCPNQCPNNVSSRVRTCQPFGTGCTGDNTQTINCLTTNCPGLCLWFVVVLCRVVASTEWTRRSISVRTSYVHFKLSDTCVLNHTVDISLYRVLCAQKTRWRHRKGYWSKQFDITLTRSQPMTLLFYLDQNCQPPPYWPTLESTVCVAFFRSPTLTSWQTSWRRWMTQ